MYGGKCLFIAPFIKQLRKQTPCYPPHHSAMGTVHRKVTTGEQNQGIHILHSVGFHRNEIQQVKHCETRVFVKGSLLQGNPQIRPQRRANCVALFSPGPKEIRLGVFKCSHVTFDHQNESSQEKMLMVQFTGASSHTLGLSTGLMLWEKMIHRPQAWGLGKDRNNRASDTVLGPGLMLLGFGRGKTETVEISSSIGWGVDSRVLLKSNPTDLLYNRRWHHYKTQGTIQSCQRKRIRETSQWLQCPRILQLQGSQGGCAPSQENL